MHTKLQELLKLAVANKASDVHLMADITPKFRIDGELLNAPNWDVDQNKIVTEMINSLLTDKQRENLKQFKEVDRKRN